MKTTLFVQKKNDMVTHHTAYDEIADFIAQMAPEKLVTYTASPTLQRRINDLLDKNKEDGLTPEERSELEHYLLIDHLISLAKLRARRLLSVSV